MSLSPGQIYARTRLYVFAVVLFALCGCASSEGGEAEKAAESEFVGRPPPASEDPFAVREVPGEAVAAEPRGRISEEDFEEPVPPERSRPDPTEWDEALSTRERDRAQKKEGAGEEVEPESEPSEEAPAPEVSTGYQCFSCVRICPEQGDCDTAREDVICGWGVESNESRARELATAECDATLDMARQMPVWSRIEGQCPAATCRRR